jgi:hypothetical protein
MATGDEILQSFHPMNIDNKKSRVKKTKKAYEQYLNENSPPQGDDKWTIEGVIRMNHMWRNAYGEAIRKFDPIQFEVGYNEFKNK